MIGAWRVPEASLPAEWQDVTVRYRYGERDAIGPVSLEVRAGERLLLLGPSGSGKSTLLTTLTGLVPQTIPAKVNGEISLFGRAVSERSPADWSDTVAQLFQNAEQTLCGMTVADEIAFALENRGLPEADIVASVNAAMNKVELPQDWKNRRTTALSGGEKQLVALAAALAQEAPIFIADEPTAHLAPEAAARLRSLLVEEDRRRSIVIVDHRLDELITGVDRVAVLGGEGTIIAAGAPRALFREHGAKLAELGIWRPVASALDEALGKAGIAPQTPPLTVAEALHSLDPGAADARAVVGAFVTERTAPPSEPGEIVAALHDASCAPLFGPTVLTGVSLAIRRGETLGIVGRNGAGKSTLGASLAGMLRLKQGRREGAPGGIAFQNPENQFVTGSVREEVLGALGPSMPTDLRQEEADRLLSVWRLGTVAKHHPFELSQGQKRRLALITLTASDQWPLLVMDEPTAGLDAAGAATMLNLLEELRMEGRAVALITHEMDFALKACTRLLVVGEGGILADGPALEIMRDASLLGRAGLAQPAIMPAMEWLEARSC